MVFIGRPVSWMKTVWYSGLFLSGTTQSVLDKQFVDAKEMGAKTILLLGSAPKQNSQAYTERSLWQAIVNLLTSSVFPPTPYAHFNRFDLCLLLEINHDSKRKIFQQLLGK